MVSLPAAAASVKLPPPSIASWTAFTIFSIAALRLSVASLAEISAPLSRLPLSPTFSMSREAVSPCGFFHTQPAEARASGWVAFFCLSRTLMSRWISAKGRRCSCRRAPISTEPGGAANIR